MKPENLHEQKGMLGLCRLNRYECLGVFDQIELVELEVIVLLWSCGAVVKEEL
jgi:hypothetical protein